LTVPKGTIEIYTEPGYYGTRKIYSLARPGKIIFSFYPKSLRASRTTDDFVFLLDKEDKNSASDYKYIKINNTNITETIFGINILAWKNGAL
jgi:hypothetical protein